MILLWQGWGGGVLGEEVYVCGLCCGQKACGNPWFVKSKEAALAVISMTADGTVKREGHGRLL